MKVQIILAAALVCGLISIGCSDSDSGGSGLNCDSDYSVPTSLEQRTIAAIVIDGGGVLCGVEDATASLEFGPFSPLAANEFKLTTITPPECVDEENRYYTYFPDGPLGTLNLYEYFDTDPDDYLGEMEFCQTTLFGGNYAISIVDGSWQTGTWEFTDIVTID